MKHISLYCNDFNQGLTRLINQSHHYLETKEYEWLITAKLNNTMNQLQWKHEASTRNKWQARENVTHFGFCIGWIVGANFVFAVGPIIFDILFSTNVRISLTWTAHLVIEKTNPYKPSFETTRNSPLAK